MNSWLFLVDCNSFFASCEQLFNPALRGKPVVVLSGNEGCVLARSKEAKKLGIPMGAPAYQFATLFRQKKVFTFPANFSLYSDLSRRVMEVLAQFSPDLEQYSIDEAFLCIACEDPLAKAEEIRQRVEKWTGIPVAVGIGMTKTLAKLASDLAKSRKGTYLTSENDPQFAHLDVQEIWGIGSRLAVQLKKLGICTVRDFIQCDPGWIKKRFSIVVQRILLELRGHSCLPLEEIESPNQSILCSRSFKEAVEPFDELRPHLANHTASAARKLRAQGTLCSALTVFIYTSPYSQPYEPVAKLHGSEKSMIFGSVERPGAWPYRADGGLPRRAGEEERAQESEKERFYETKSFATGFYSNSSTYVLSEPTDYTPTLISCAGSCLEKIYRPGYRYKKLGVHFSGLIDKSTQQSDLFGESPEKKAKKARIMDLIDRFDKGAIRLASQPPSQAPSQQRYTTCWDELPTIII